jgi:hypothetical protein
VPHAVRHFDFSSDSARSFRPIVHIENSVEIETIDGDNSARSSNCPTSNFCLPCFRRSAFTSNRAPQLNWRSWRYDIKSPFFNVKTRLPRRRRPITAIVALAVGFRRQSRQLPSSNRTPSSSGIGKDFVGIDLEGSSWKKRQTLFQRKLAN